MRPLRWRAVSWLIGAYYALALVVMGSVVLVRVAQGSQPTPRAPRKPLAADIPAPVPPSSPEPVPTPSATSVPVIRKPVQMPRRIEPTVIYKAPSVQSPSGPASEGGSLGVASFYGARPAKCWDARGGHALPLSPDGRPLETYTAHPSLPCGTLVTVSGPAGSVTVPVEDHGPWLAGRVLDLSPATFLAVAGSLSVGIVTVRYRVVP